MNRIRVLESLQPQILAPCHREGLGKFLVRKSSTDRASLSIDQLQVPKLMKKDVVEQEAPDGNRWPLRAPLGPEMLRDLIAYKESRQTHAWRQRTDCYLSTPAIDVPKKASAATSIIEMDGPEPIPALERKPTEDDLYVFPANVVNTISARDRR